MSADDSSKRRRSLLGCGGCLLLAVGLPLLILLGVLATWSIRSSRAVNAQLARVREAGEPLTAEDLEAYYEGTPQQVALAELWLAATRPLEGEAFQKAAEKLPIVGQSEAKIPPPGKPWPELEAVEKLLKQYEAPLQQLHEAAAVGGPARYPTDFSRGIEGFFQNVTLPHAGARMLALEAHVRAHRGDAHGAAQSIHAVLSLSNSLRDEPIIVSQVARSACNNIALNLVREMLPAVQFSTEDMDMLAVDLKAVDMKRGTERAMLGERVIGIQMLEDPATLGQGANTGQLPLFGPMRDDTLAVYLECMEQEVAAVRLPWPQALQAQRAISQQMDARDSTGAPVAYIFTILLTPALDVALTAAARGTALNDAARTAIAIERYRRENGKPPARLADLVPKFLPSIPTDPFDGQPLRYVLRETEYVIYSVGANGIDDRGQGDDNGSPDIVFPVKLRAAGGEKDRPSTDAAEHPRSSPVTP